MDDGETKRYRITANYKNCTYQRETWTRLLSTDKVVRIQVCGYFRWGTFYIELNDTDKALLLEKDSVDLSNYPYEMEDLMGSLWGDNEVVINNKDKYSADELREIYRSIYITEDMAEEGIVYDSNTDYPLDTGVLEENNWDLDDTQYGFSTGCVLTDEDEEAPDSADED